MNDQENSALYQQYADLAAGQDKVVFGGRLGSYRYYDMDQVIAEALAVCENLVGAGKTVRKNK